MKFISKYRNLKVILRPTRREVHEVGGDKETIVHPPVVAEFENGMFDTAVAVPRLQARIQCCERHASEVTEVKLIKALEGNMEFGTAFQHFHEISKAEQLKEAEALVAKLREEVGEVAKDGGSDEAEQPDAGAGADANTEAFEKMSYKDLQGAYSKKFGKGAVGISKAGLIEALSK